MSLSMQIGDLWPLGVESTLCVLCVVCSIEQSTIATKYCEKKKESIGLNYQKD